MVFDRPFDSLNWEAWPYGQGKPVAYQLYDDLLGHVHSVTVVHPPHVGLITRAQVMNDKIAARTLAKLHAAGLLPSIWIPPLDVRDHHALVAQRAKMVRLSTQAKNLVGYAGL